MTHSVLQQLSSPRYSLTRSAVHREEVGNSNAIETIETYKIDLESNEPQKSNSGGDSIVQKSTKTRVHSYSSPTHSVPDDFRNTDDGPLRHYPKRTLLQVGDDDDDDLYDDLYDLYDSEEEQSSSDCPLDSLHCLLCLSW